MAKEAKADMVHFSLPYRAGMESEPDYIGQVEMMQKGHPGEKVFAKFAIPLDMTIVIDPGAALAFGDKALRQNTQRGPAIAKKAEKYGIVVAGGTGEPSKKDRDYLSDLVEMAKGDWKAVVKVIGLSKGASNRLKAMTLDELKKLVVHTLVA